MSEINTAVFASEAGTVPAVINNGDNFTKVSERAPQDAPQSSKFYTEDDLARVRGQEKDKLYPQIDKLKEELDAIKREREDERSRIEAETAAKEQARVTEERRKLEEEMGLRELLEKRQQEMQEQLEIERQEREKAFALLERERKFSEINSYKTKRIEDERDNIIPELIDLVQGDSTSEVEVSIQSLKERSAKILEAAQSAMQATRKDMTGTRPTAPPAGPLDINTGTRQFTAEDIQSMGMNEYAKYRQQLLSDRALGREQGLFG